MIQFTLSSEEAGKRIDKVLRTRLDYCSLGEIFKLFRKNKVKLDGKRCKGKEHGVEGSEVLLYVNEEELRAKGSARSEQNQTDFFTENFVVLFENKVLLACNKPSGIPVHPGKGTKKGYSLIELAEKYATEHVAKTFTPRLIHRIDSGTSGVILIAKNEGFLREVLGVFERGRVYKQYAALCHGVFKKEKGTITDKLSRTSSSSKGMTMKVGDEDGLDAHTEYKVVRQYENYALVKIKIQTGRTHQIRTHMAHIGHPLVGDDRYGDRELDKGFKEAKGLKKIRLYLHSESISFRVHSLGKKLQLVAPMPKEFKE